MKNSEKIEALTGIKIILLMRRKKQSYLDGADTYGFASVFVDALDSGWFKGLKYPFSLWSDIVSTLKPIKNPLLSNSFDETIEGIEKVINQIKNTNYESLY
jgi:hypothetical protein